MRRGVIRGWPVRVEVVEQAESVEPVVSDQRVNSHQPAVSDQTALTLEEQLPAELQPAPPRGPALDRQLWPWLLVLLVLVLAGIAVLYFTTRDGSNRRSQTTTRAPVQPTPLQPTTAPNTPATPAARTPKPSPRVAVPRLVGLPAPTALTRLRRLGLHGSTHSVLSDQPQNDVIAQTPGSSRELAPGATVLLAVSKGPEAVAIPDVGGQTVADALSILRAEAFRAHIVRVPSGAPPGQVVAQHPKAGAKARPGIVVRLNVSEGKQSASSGKENMPTTTAATTNPEATPTSGAPANGNSVVRVPDLEGKKLIDARRLVRRVGLVIEIRRVPNAEPLGTVISQAKKAGTQLKRGTHLLVTVSAGRRPSTQTTTSQSGSQPVDVPDVTGKDETTATQDLEAAGLTVRVADRDTSDAAEDGIVIEQTPAADQSVQPDSTVTIYVGRYTGG